MTKQRRPRWAVLIALASASLLSGCYYYPYGYYPWGYPYPQPYAGGYPYSPGYPYPAPPGPAVAPPTSLTPPPDAPIQQAPLPTAS
jgi:hypothetical protein